MLASWLAGQVPLLRQVAFRVRLEDCRYQIRMAGTAELTIQGSLFHSRDDGANRAGTNPKEFHGLRTLPSFDDVAFSINGLPWVASTSCVQDSTIPSVPLYWGSVQSAYMGDSKQRMVPISMKGVGPAMARGSRTRMSRRHALPAEKIHRSHPSRYALGLV